MEDNRRVAKAGLLTAGAAVLCRLVSLGKELFVAAVFGAGVVTDAYALAMLIPAIGAALFLTAGRRAFLVLYPRFRREGEPAAADFAQQSLASLLALALGAAVVGALVLPSLWPRLILGDDPAVIAESQRLAAPAAWLIVPIAAIAGLTSVLNAQQRFAAPQLTAVIPTLSVVAAVWIAGPAAGALALVAGLLVGSVLQSGVLAGMARRAGNRFTWRWNVRSRACSVLWRFALPLILLDLVTQGNVYVDRAMATWLAPGKVAILTWSAMMKDFISGTLVASLLLVLLPHFAEQAARGAAGELRRSAALVLRYSAILLFPVSALLCVCAPPLFRSFSLGALDAQATGAMAVCLAAYGLGLFADLASTALYQALLALGRIRTLLLLAVGANLLPNLVLNLLLIGPLKEVGLALSTSLVGYCTLLANYLVLRRCVGAHEELRNLRIMAGALLASGVMAAAGWAVLESVRTAWPTAPWSDAAGAIAAAAAAVALGAFLLLVSPGSDDARVAARLVAGKLRAAIGRLVG